MKLSSDEIALLGVGFTILFGLTTVIFGLVAWYQARRAYKLEAKIAEFEGSLLKPADLHLRWPFGDPGILFILAVPIRIGRQTQVPISFALENHGQRTAKEAEIYIRIPLALCMPDMPGVTQSFKSESLRVNSRAISVQEGHRTFTFNVAAIDPANRVNINHALFISAETIIEHEVTGRTRDQHDVSMTVHAAMSYEIQVTLTAQDRRPWTGVYNLMVINTDQRSVAEALAPFNRERMARHNKMLAELSWWRRIRYRETSSKLRVLVVDGEKLTPNSSLPIDEASGEFTVTEGVELPYGFFVPALGVQLETP